MEEKIGTIKDILADTAIEDISAFIAKYSQDERKGVVKLVDSARKKLEAYEKEKERIYMMHEFEREYASYGSRPHLQQHGCYKTHQSGYGRRQKRYCTENLL